MKRADWSGKEMTVLQDRAEEFGSDPRFFELLMQSATDEDLWARAMKDPRELLGERGIEIPDGLSVEAFENGHAMPGPDFEMYQLILTNCRVAWVRKKDGIGYEKVEFCRSFRIVTNPIPGGPRGRG